MEQGTFDFPGATGPAPVQLCECGCGEPAPIAKMTKRSLGHVKGQPVRFIQGHSFKLKAARLAAQRALELPAEPKLCECGCGEPAPIATHTSKVWGHVQGQPMRFIRGHSARLTAAQRIDMLDPADVPPDGKLCECGCGLPAPIAKQNNPERGHIRGLPVRFIKGHTPGAQGPKPSLRKLFAEAGQRIGRSVVLDPEITISCPSKPTIRAARLRCECGEVYIRSLVVLFRRADGESCGCARFADLSGQSFGKLTVIRWAGTKRTSSGNMARWLCRCECGNEVVVHGKSLVDGHNQSCGCGRLGPRRGLGPGDAALNSLMSTYIANARARDLGWELTRDDFRRLTSEICHYCDTEPFQVVKGHPSSGDYVYNGIDRKDNALGYVEGNVLSACGPCNHAKATMTYGEFLALARRIAARHPLPEQFDAAA